MATTKENRYIEAVGRRKTSVARVRLTPSPKTTFKINNRDFATYFPTAELRSVIESSLKLADKGTYTITANIKGGGVHSQAEAMRLGISRALSDKDDAVRIKLKSAGMLKRDPRAKERRKFGLKKARKAPQWSKR